MPEFIVETLEQIQELVAPDDEDEDQPNQEGGEEG